MQVDKKAGLLKTVISILAIGLAASELCAGPGSKEYSPRRAETSIDPTKNPASPKIVQGALDTSKVRALYLDGEFEDAIIILESILKDPPKLSHSDSVFIFKHLGVMFAADYEKRERGKMYMFQLLLTEPTAKIMDMYASDMIYMIFKNMQDEFETKRVRLGRPGSGGIQQDTLGKNAKAEPDSRLTEKSSTGKTLIWIGATGVVVAAGVVAYFTLEPGETAVTKKIHYPE